MTDTDKHKIKTTYLSQEQWTDVYVAKHNTLFESVVELGRMALKVCLVMNGASALALLAFIGQVWSTDQSIQVIGQLNSSLYYFALGVVFVFVAVSLAYVSESVSLLHYERGHPIVELTPEQHESREIELKGLDFKIRLYIAGSIFFLFLSVFSYVHALNIFVDATYTHVSTK